MSESKRITHGQAKKFLGDVLSRKQPGLMFGASFLNAYIDEQQERDRLTMYLANYQIGHHTSRDNCQCEPCRAARQLREGGSDNG